MSELHTAQIELRSLDGKESFGQLGIRVLSQHERLVSAGKRLLIFWAIAVAFVPVPAIHFVAVPVFLILGPIMAILAYRVDRRFVTDASIGCPVCHKSVPLAGLRVQAGFKDRCPNCLNDLFVQVKS